MRIATSETGGVLAHPSNAHDERPESHRYRRYDPSPTRVATLTLVSRIFTTSVAPVYPHYVAKVEKKGRTQDVLDEVICWLSGFDEVALHRHLDAGTTFEDFAREVEELLAAHPLVGVAALVGMPDSRLRPREIDAKSMSGSPPWLPRSRTAARRAGRSGAMSLTKQSAFPQIRPCHGQGASSIRSIRSHKAAEGPGSATRPWVDVGVRRTSMDERGPLARAAPQP